MYPINVQFEDEEEAIIVAYFSCPQDPGVYLHQGQVDAADPRWHSYYDSQPSMTKRYLPMPS